jgi:hypothetical protein
MTVGCPRCGAEVRQGARYCTKCGLDLGARPGPSLVAHDTVISTPVYVRTPESGSHQESSGTLYPYSRLAGHSVVKALSPSAPAKGHFWVGLALFLGGFGLAACQVLLGLALDLSADGAGSPLGISAALAVSGCLMFVVSLVGATLIALGRPRAGR